MANSVSMVDVKAVPKNCSDEDNNFVDIGHEERESSRMLSDTTVDYSDSECSVLDVKDLDYIRGSTWPSGVLIMANVCLGMGILNFPRIVYEAGGIMHALLVLLIFVSLIAGSLYITVYCCRYYACVNFQDMVRVHCGPFFGTLCSVMLFLELTGALVVKMVVLSDQLDRFYSISTGDDLAKVWFLMPIVAVVAFLPMCFIKDFSCFKYVSIGGILAAIYVTFGVAVGGYFMLGEAEPETFRETTKEPRDFNLLLPLLVFGYHGHVEAPLVFSNLKKQRLYQFMRTVYSYLFIATVSYAVTAIFGYLTFARNTNVDFLLNYPKSNWLANIAILLVSFKIFTSFPVLFFVDRSVFNVFYMLIVKRLPQSRIREHLENFSVARFLQTIIVFFLIIFLATIIPNISNAISLIGSVSCHFCFTFPGLCFFCLYEKSTVSNKKYFLRKISGIAYITLGMFFFGANITVSIQALFKGTSAI